MGILDIPPPRDPVVVSSTSQLLSRIDAGRIDILVAPGTYILDESLIPALGGTNILGLGQREVVFRSSGNFPVIAGVWQDSLLENVILDANNTGAVCANVHMDKTVFRNVKMQGWTDYGIRLNDGTYSNNLGLLNRLQDCWIDQATGVGIYQTYRWTDSWIEGNNVGSTLANISLEGGPVRVLSNHLNGAPRYNVELRGNKRILISNNILEGSRREAVIYTMPSFLSSDAPDIQIVGNTFSNGGKENDDTYPAIGIYGESVTDRVSDFVVTGNLFACEDAGAGWNYIINAEHADHLSVSGNSWRTGYMRPESIRAIDCTDFDVSGNTGGEAAVVI